MAERKYQFERLTPIDNISAIKWMVLLLVF